MIHGKSFVERRQIVSNGERAVKCPGGAGRKLSHQPAQPDVGHLMRQKFFHAAVIDGIRIGGEVDEVQVAELRLGISFAEPESLARRDTAQIGPQAVRGAAPREVPASSALVPAQSKAESSETSALADNSTAAQSPQADANAEVLDSAIQSAGLASTAAPLPPVEVARAESDATGSLEEIMVTGSRIRSDTEFDVSYRQTREEWLQEILALGEEVINEVERLEEINTQLEEEAALFSEAYPDFDLEAELQNLEAE